MNKWNCKEEGELLTFIESINPDISHKKAKSFLAHKQIKVNGKTTSQYNKKLHKGDTVSIDTTSHKTSVELPIIYEDKDLIVVNKRAGLLTIATETEKEKTLYHMVRAYVKEIQKNGTIFIVHRLDKDTSGIVVFAKNEKMKLALQDNWNELVEKRGYVALVEGTFDKTSGTVNTYLVESKSHIVHSTSHKSEGKQAITRYKVLKQNDAFALLDIEIETGRKNQIRVHMSDLGHPVVGDKKYGSTENSLKRLCLHAYVLEINHPFTHKKLIFKTEVPKEFKRLVK